MNDGQVGDDTNPQRRRERSLLGRAHRALERLSLEESNVKTEKAERFAKRLMEQQQREAEAVRQQLADAEESALGLSKEMELLKTAAEAAALAKPCDSCGCHDLTQYGKQDTCFNRACPTRSQQIDDPIRAAAEVKATAAVQSLGSRRHDLMCGVKLGFLKKFVEDYDCGGMTTYEVVRDIIKPLTRQRRCRYVELPEVVATDCVGPASLFVSHTWGAPFGLLVGGLRYA